MDFHEAAFSAGLAAEDACAQAQGFRFQLTQDEQRRVGGATWRWRPNKVGTFHH